jgi:hypothetical protein
VPKADSLENAKLSRVQKRGDGVLFVQTAHGREREHIDADEVAVGSRLDESLDGCRRGGIGCLAQRREKGLGFAHARKLM